MENRFMENRVTKFLCLVMSTIAFLSAMLATPAYGESDCCVLLPPAPNNAVTVRLTYPSSSNYFNGQVLNTGAPIPLATYAAWCVDWDTAIGVSASGVNYSGELFSSCDPNLNSHLPLHPNVQVSLAEWKKVNYIISHRAGFNFFDIQVAILAYVGGPYVYYPGDPIPNMAAVAAITNAANANAPTWEPQCGDKFAMIAQFDPTPFSNPLDDVQLVILEVPFCPPITCPADVTVECTESLDPEVNNRLGKPTAECCAVTYGYSDVVTAGNCPQNYTVTRTWMATNGCRITKTCQQTITVQDNTPPIIKCPDDISVTAEPIGPCEKVVTFVVTATDLCAGTITPICNPPSGSVFPPGETSVTCMATDPCGNSSRCGFKVTVTCPAPLPAALGNYVWVDSDNNGVQDDGPQSGLNGVTVNLLDCNYQPIMVNNQPVTMVTANDTFGNPGYYLFTDLMPGCYIVEFIKPCGYDFTLQNQGNIATDSDVDVANGWSGQVNLAAGETNLTIDAGLICVAPTFTGLPPSTASYQCIGDVLAPPTVTAKDNCDDDVVVNFDQKSVGPDCDRVITRTWSVTDKCGKVVSFTQTITVKDTIPPVLTKGSIGSCYKTVGEAEAAAIAATTGSDNCSAVRLSASTSGECSAVITVTGTDACNNPASVTYNTHIDNTRPVLSGCPATTVSVQCIADVPLPANVTANDNCDGQLAVSFNESSAGPDCDKTITRTWSATDTCGNTTTCSQTITVKDTTPPTLTKGSIGSCYKTVAEAEAAAVAATTGSDNCSAVRLSASTSGECSAVITVTGTDACNNPASVTYNTRIDNTPPVIKCPADYSMPKQQVLAFCSFTPGGWGSVRAGNNVGALLTANFPTVYPNGVEIGIPGDAGFSAKFSSAAAVTAFLPNGGSSGPLVGDLVDATSSSAGALAQHTLALTLNVDYSAAGLTAGSSGPLGDLILNLPGSPFNGFTISQVLATANTALGGGGFPAGVTASQLNDLVDELNNAFVDCIGSAWATNYLLLGPGSPAPDGSATATDNCDSNPTITYADKVVVDGCATRVVRTWTATDTCGNHSECDQTLTVSPCPPPAPLTLQCAEGNGQVGVPYTSAFVASGGVPPYTFSITGGFLPSGLTLNPSTGEITGIPSEAGNFSFTVTVTDSTGTAAGTTAVNCSIRIIGVGGCRVTGGSNRETNNWQALWITSVLPTHISHGGQVGAAYSVETPFSPNSACISGEWQHNRHLKGNSLVGTFHAAGNGNVHQFDSLLCACLPCAEDLGAVGVVGGVCNPNNRICGPEPRRAPANKICFSGVGDYTYTTGNKTVKAVFRVDIEDRSEGNSAAGSAPRDRYRIRLWLLDPAIPGRNADPNSPDSMALRFAASADPDQIANLATTENLKINIQPDIDDGGNMTQGNHQIHPETGATCGALAPTPAANRIDVSTLVASLTSSGLSAFGVTAQAYEGAQDPKFVYQTTIKNSGTVSLTGLSVVEITGSTTNNVTSRYFASGATIAPGTSVTRYYTNVCTTDTVVSVTVSATSLSGASARAAGTALALVALAQPTGLAAVSTSGKVTLTWNAIAGATYNVKRATTIAGPFTTLNKSGLSTATYADSSVVNGTLYYYVVSALKNGVETANSTPVSAFPSAALPSPWLTSDVGLVGAAGGASYISGKFTLVGSGIDIAGTADEFRYVYQMASGDCSIIARVLSVGNTDPSAKAGLMIRETLLDGSKNASVFLTPSSGIIAQARISTGGTSTGVIKTGIVAPYWLKGVRSGSTFTAYYSSNGSSWTAFATQSVSMGSTVYIGLGVTSHNDGTLCPAVFDSVTATP
jgi:hypothetical protein